VPASLLIDELDGVSLPTGVSALQLRTGSERKNLLSEGQGACNQKENCCAIDPLHSVIPESKSCANGPIFARLRVCYCLRG